MLPILSFGLLTNASNSGRVISAVHYFAKVLTTDEKISAEAERLVLTIHELGT